MSIESTPAASRRIGTSRPVLMSLFAVVLVSIVAVLLTNARSGSTIVGSGVPAAQVRTLPPFTSVDVNGVSNLNLRVGATQSVVIRADDNILGHVSTRVVSGTLVIGTKPGSYDVKTPIAAQVVVPAVAAMRLGGNGDIVASGIRSSALTLSLDGHGSIRASGAAGQLRVIVTGAGDAYLGALRARDATVLVNGFGNVTLTATNSLNAAVTGYGSIRYLGNPARVTRTVTGAGEVTPG